jgi:hypothetical protein
MSERTTQVLLAAVCLLLLVQLVSRAAATAEPASGPSGVPAVLRARAIELVDDRGRPRASLEIETGGDVVFRMRDAGGAIRVKLGASRQGSALLLLDERTEPAAHLVVDPGATTLTLARQGGRRLVLEPERAP